MLKKFLSTVKNDWFLINTSIKWMGVIVALKSAGIGLIDPLFSIFLYDSTHSYASVGRLLALLGIVSLLTTIPLIRVADHVKNKIVVWHGLQLYSVAALFYFLSIFYHYFSFLVIALAIHGVSYAMVDDGAESYVLKHSDSHNASRSFGYFSSIRNLGWILGVLIGGSLFPFYGFKGLFLAIIPFMLINSFLLHFIQEGGITSMMAAFRRYFTHLKDLGAIFHDFHKLGQPMIFIYVMIFFDELHQVLVFAFLPLLASEMALDYFDIALLMVIISLPSVFSFFFAEIADRVNRIDLITLGLLIVLISFGLLFVSTLPVWIMVLTTLSSLGMAFVKPAYNGLIADLVPHSMLGEVISIKTFIVRAAMVICPLLFGSVSDAWGLRFNFLFASSFAALLIFFALFVKNYGYTPSLK